jgi:adenine phosphoribosyltransferase
VGLTVAGLPIGELRARLRRNFVWLSDRTDDVCWANVTPWWRDPEVVASLGSALAAQFEDERATVVMGVQPRGCLLGMLVAQHLGLGFVEIRKDPTHPTDSNRIWQRTTPPE